MKAYIYPCIALLAILSAFLGCDLVEKLEPKSFVDVFYGKMAEKEWIVDSIHFTRRDAQGALAYDTAMPVGKMIFYPAEKLPAGLKPGTVGTYMGVLFHTYTDKGRQRTDTTAWRWKGSGTTVTYLSLHYPNYQAGPGIFTETIYDIKEVTDKSFVFIRDERIVDDRIGQYQGTLRSAYKMHR